MLGRLYAPQGRYRYEYQGQETEKEFYDGAVSFAYRVEDPRIVRFLSVDPLDQEFPWNSPYAVQENKFGMGRELEGLELTPLLGISDVVVETGTFAAEVSTASRAAPLTGTSTISSSSATSSALSSWRVFPGGNISRSKPLTPFDPFPFTPYQPQLTNSQSDQNPAPQQSPEKQPQTKPNPERQFDPYQKPTKEDDNQEGYYIYETGSSGKASEGLVDKSAGKLPYFGITKNALIASSGINGRYHKDNPRAKNLSSYRGILGKTDYFSAAGVEAALIALNTYGKNFEQVVLRNKHSSADVKKSTRIDNKGFSNKSRVMIETGIAWLRKNYGRNWKSQFLHKENKKGKNSP